MPLLQLNLTDYPLKNHQRHRLMSGLSKQMGELLGKREDLTVVNITHSAVDNWSVGGAPLNPDGWCGSLMVHITAGTNSPSELSAFIAAANSLLLDILASPPQAPVYIVINEIPANSWGYGGETQLERRVQVQQASVNS